MLPEKNLRESLCSVEPISPDRQQRLRDEIARTVDVPLSGGKRMYYILLMAGLAIGVPGAVYGIGFDAEHRWVWALSLGGATLYIAWIWHILRRGSEPLRIMRHISKSFASIGAMFAFFLIFHGLENPSLVGLFWALLGLLICLLMSFINLWNRVIAAERMTREQILRVEYRLADLSSKLVPPTRP